MSQVGPDLWMPVQRARFTVNWWILGVAFAMLLPPVGMAIALYQAISDDRPAARLAWLAIYTGALIYTGIILNGMFG